jgi:hypothetical protein
MPSLANTPGFVLLGTDELLEPGAGHWYCVHLLGCVSLVCGSPARLCLFGQPLCFGGSKTVGVSA